MGLLWNKMMAETPKLHRDVAAWLYEVTKDPAVAVVLLGSMSAIANKNPKSTYWEVLEMSKQLFIEKAG